MDDCIFCKIARGEIPAEKVYEDGAALAFLDIHPKAPGHTLLIPKKHYRWFTDMPQDEWQALMGKAQAVAKDIKARYDADFVRLGAVGTDVPHVHIHLIPQKLRDTEPKI